MDNEIVNRAPTSVFKSINTSTYPSRILKKGTRAPNKVYVYADGRVRWSGEDVNGNEVLKLKMGMSLNLPMALEIMNSHQERELEVYYVRDLVKRCWYKM